MAETASNPTMVQAQQSGRFIYCDFTMYLLDAPRCGSDAVRFGNRDAPYPSVLTMRTVLTGLLVCASVFAQVRPRPAQPASPGAAAVSEKPGSVRGTVFSNTGEPLRKAEVTLRSTRGGVGYPGAPAVMPGIAVTTTDAGGNYSFDAVPPGTYVLSVQKAGHVRTEYSARGSGAGPTGRAAASSFQVSAGGTTSGIDVRMMPHAVVTGKVTDEDGEPVMHASVQVIRERWTGGRRQYLQMNSDATDDRGEYRIAGLLPGRYYLQASANRPMFMHEIGKPRTDGTADQSYVALFYPGVSDLGQAQALNLTPGQETRGVDFVMRKASTWRIRGNVLDESGKPMMNASVMALPADTGMVGGRSMGLVRGPEGKFEISGITPGNYTLIVNRGGGREEPRQTGRMTVSVGSRDLDNVVVQLQRQFEISGLVRIDGESAGVSLTGVRITLEPLEPGLMFMSGGGNGAVTASGTWTTGGVSPGRYRILPVTLPAGTYLKAVMAGGQDISGGAQISSAASGIEVVLGTKAPDVSGTVLNAEKQPVTTGTVFLVPDAARRDRPSAYKSASLGDGGTFRFSSVPPGQYTIYAMSEVEDGSWYDPEFIRQMEGRGVALKLAEGQAETVQVPLAQ